MSIVFNNAQLPNIVRPERMGWLRGFGWGLGYVGGLIALVIVLAASMAMSAWRHASARLERASGCTGPASALWLAVFVVPMFLFTPDRHGAACGSSNARARAASRCSGTLRRLRHYTERR